MGFCQNIPTWFWASYFQDLNFFHFSWHIIGLVCRTVTICLPMQRARLSGPPRYIERCHKGYRTFSSGTWKKSFSSKYEVLSEYSNLTLDFIFQNLNLIFWVETFFQMLLEIVSRALPKRSRYLGGPLNIALCIGKKKSWPYDTPIRLYVRKSEKSWDFEKWSPKSG